MSKRMTIEDLLSRCHETLEEARNAVASLPRTDPDRHIFFCGQFDNGRNVYVRASDEERAALIAAVWYGEGCLDIFKIRPDACPGCGKAFDAMVPHFGSGSFEETKKLAAEAEAFLLANLAVA